MTASVVSDSSATRRISHRTAGNSHGPVVRLMSPSDLGHVIKPFVFLDSIDAPSAFFGQMPMHPHSGIATVTVVTEGNLHFDDPEAGSGSIGYGGVEWMRASGGVWHGKEMSAGTSATVKGFQLWLALPPELENAAVDSQYIESGQMPRTGLAQVIIGSYEGVQSPVRAPDGITYLLVTIPAGESWTYTPPPGHDSLWLSLSHGSLVAPEPAIERELVIFAAGDQPITLRAGDKNAVLVIGSAAPHPYDLKLGYYSVHTSEEALKSGEAKIQEIGRRLRLQKKPQDPLASVPVFR